MKSDPYLQARLERYPRIALAEYPTALVRLGRLSREVGREIYIKRDDQIGPGLGGNKTRKLEFLLADAKRAGAQKVATFGGLQSNHARLTAAAALICGLEPHLFYFEPRPAQLTGNLLLNEIMGAHLHFMPIPRGDEPAMSLETTVRLAHAAILARIGRHYFIPVGGHNWLGGLGYVAAALEIDEQARALGIGGARLVLAAGSGGTLAGLLAGLALGGSGLRPLGIDVGNLWRGFPDSIARLANEIWARLADGTGPEPRAGAHAAQMIRPGGPATVRPKPANGELSQTAQPGTLAGRGRAGFTPAQVPLIERQYVGQGYAVPTAAGDAAIRLLARTEGIFLDPVYTGKAFAGLLDLIAQGAIGQKEPVIFLHTGGAPALFA